MRRWFLSLFVCLALVMGVRMAKAANIGLENVPGGAAITYWTCADGYQTLINVQNVLQPGTVAGVQSTAMLVHVVFYDQDSQEIMDFNVPLSAFDNWGAAVTCENGQLVVKPVTSFYVGPNNGGEVRRAPTDATEGYVTVAITALDRRGTPNDARDDAILRGDQELPNGIILRSAMVNYSAGNAYALNSFSLVNFRNLNNNAVCLATSKNGVALANKPGDDTNGIRIGLCELLALADTNAAGPAPNFVSVAFSVGSPAAQYWARYGKNDIVDTSLILIFPAQGGNNSLDMTVFDDNEMSQSAYFRAPEVAHIRLGEDITAFEAGEILINVRPKDWDGDKVVDQPATVRGQRNVCAASGYNFTFRTAGSSCVTNYRPSFFGFSLVEGPNFADIYPIIRTNFAACVDATGCFVY